MNVNFQPGFGSAQFIGIADSGVLSKFHFAINQIVQGLVVDISDNKVVLSLGGRLVEARSDVPLTVGDVLTMQVRESSPNQVLMRLVPQQGNSWRPITDQDLTNLLDSLHLPADGLNRQIVKQLMTQGFELTRGNLLDVRESLPQGIAPDEPIVQATIFLRSLGLPVTEGSINLVRNQYSTPPDRGAQLASLEDAIKELLQHIDGRQESNAGGQSFRNLLDEVLTKVEGLKLEPESGDAHVISRELSRLIIALGDSVEGKAFRMLLQEKNIGDLGKDEQGLLIKLMEETQARSGLAQEGLSREIGNIHREAGRFLESIHFEQLLNAANLSDGLQESSFLFSLPVQDNGQMRTLKMRVTPDAERERSAGDSNSRVKVELEVDLSELGPTSISLSFLNRSMQCHFANSDLDIVGLIKGESVQLKTDLEQRGFEVGSITFGQTVAVVPSPSSSGAGQPVGSFRVDIQA